MSVRTELTGKTPAERVAVIKKAGYVVPERVRSVELKAWVQGPRGAGGLQLFMHCSTASPDEINASHGLDPKFAREICLYDRPWVGDLPRDAAERQEVLKDCTPVGRQAGQVVLAAATKAPTAQQNGRYLIKLPPFVRRQGFLGDDESKGFVYIFALDPVAAGMTIYSDDGTTVEGTEVGFDETIPTASIRAYGDFQMIRGVQTVSLVRRWNDAGWATFAPV